MAIIAAPMTGDTIRASLRSCRALGRTSLVTVTLLFLGWETLTPGMEIAKIIVLSVSARTRIILRVMFSVLKLFARLVFPLCFWCHMRSFVAALPNQVPP